MIVSEKEVFRMAKNMFWKKAKMTNVKTHNNVSWNPFFLCWNRIGLNDFRKKESLTSIICTALQYFWHVSTRFDEFLRIALHSRSFAFLQNCTKINCEKRVRKYVKLIYFSNFSCMFLNTNIFFLFEFSLF